MSPSLPPPSPDPAGQTASFEPLSPRIRWVWLITGVISDLIGLGLIAVITGFVDVRSAVSVPRWVYACLVGAALLVIPLRSIYVRAAYRRWRFRLTPTGVELVHGVVWRRSSAMPYHRLQQVDTSQGPLERIADLTTIQLRSAAATTDAAIPGIDPGRVADLRRELLARAGRDDGT